MTRQMNLQDRIASAEFLLARAKTHARDPRDTWGEPITDAETLRRLAAGVELRERELAELIAARNSADAR